VKILILDRWVYRSVERFAERSSSKKRSLKVNYKSVQARCTHFRAFLFIVQRALFFISLIV